MPAPIVDDEYKKSIEKARRSLRAFIAEKNCAPIMLRLAWHDAGTYDVNTRTGGPNGSIRAEREYSHGANAGLKIAIDFCGMYRLPPSSQSQCLFLKKFGDKKVIINLLRYFVFHSFVRSS
jgi:hypothetical protein